MIWYLQINGTPKFFCYKINFLISYEHIPENNYLSKVILIFYKMISIRDYLKEWVPRDKSGYQSQGTRITLTLFTCIQNSFGRSHETDPHNEQGYVVISTLCAATSTYPAMKYSSPGHQLEWTLLFQLLNPAWEMSIWENNRANSTKSSKQIREGLYVRHGDTAIYFINSLLYFLVYKNSIRTEKLLQDKDQKIYV